MAVKYCAILVIFSVAGVVLGENEVQNQLKQINNIKPSSPEAPLAYSANVKQQGSAESVISPVQSDYQPQYFQQKAPTKYSNSIPAAAIRNVETVAVTKTITPVVTKTTTYKTHSEPALSIGHVQGYSNSAIGQAKIAPVQFLTQYTSYNNPTVGINGPVTYTGPAVYATGGAGAGGQGQAFIALAPVPGAGDPLAGAYGGAVGFTSSYGNSPHSHAAPSYAKYAIVAAPSSRGQYSSYGGGLQQVKVAAAHKPSYGIPQGQPLGSYSMKYLNVMRPPPPGPAPAFHQQPQYYYRQQNGQNLRQPTMTVVQTYAAPSITLTKNIKRFS